MNEDLNPAKKGVFIPIEILFDERLTPTEKILFAEIDWLDNPVHGGCFASNERFSKLLGIKIRQVQQCISNLKKYGFIKQSAFNGRQRILNSMMIYCIRDAVNCTSAIQENARLLHIREKIKEEEVETSLPKKKPVPTTDASKYHYLSELLITKIKLSGTEMKIIPEKLIPKWAQDFRLMVEQDKKTEKQIEAMIEAVFADEFWSKQVRCASKLRKHWIEGKFDRLKVSQNAQEGQEQAQSLTPWQELCRDSGDPGQRVWDKMIKLWESLEGKAWQDFQFLPKNSSDVKEMQPIFEIMYAHNGYFKETLQKIKNHLKDTNEY